MGDINAQLDPAATAKVMQEFARQNEYMNMREDLIGDALQDAVSGSHITTSRSEGVGGMLLCVSACLVVSSCVSSMATRRRRTLS